MICFVWVLLLDEGKQKEGRGWVPYYYLDTTTSCFHPFLDAGVSQFALHACLPAA